MDDSSLTERDREDLLDRGDEPGRAFGDDEEDVPPVARTVGPFAPGPTGDRAGTIVKKTVRAGP